MSGGKKNIDEIWKALNGPQQGRPGTIGTCLGGSTNLPGVTTTTRILPRANAVNTEPVLRAHAPHAAVHGSGTSTSSAQETARAEPGIAAAASSVPGVHHALARVPMPDDIAIAAEARRHASRYDPCKAGVPPEQLAAYVATIQRTINCLSDPDRTTRKQAAASLLKKLTCGDSVSPVPEPPLLQVGAKHPGFWDVCYRLKR